MSFWDWKSGHRFQSLDTTAQPGSLDAEAGIMSSTFDRSGLRLIVGEADKTSKFALLLDHRNHALIYSQSKSGSRMRARQKRRTPFSGRLIWDSENIKAERNARLTYGSIESNYMYYTPIPRALRSTSSRSAILTSSSAIARRSLLDRSARCASRLMRPAATRSSAAVWT
jgi:hypothetical protein